MESTNKYTVKAADRIQSWLQSRKNIQFPVVRLPSPSSKQLKALMHGPCMTACSLFSGIYAGTEVKLKMKYVASDDLCTGEKWVESERTHLADTFKKSKMTFTL